MIAQRHQPYLFTSFPLSLGTSSFSAHPPLSYSIFSLPSSWYCHTLSKLVSFPILPNIKSRLLTKIEKAATELAVVAHTYNHKTWEAEASVSSAWGKVIIHDKILFLKTTQLESLHSCGWLSLLPNLFSFILWSPLPFLDHAQDSASCSFLQGLWRKPDTSGLYTTSLWLQWYLVLGNQLRLLFKTLWRTQVPLEGSLQLRRLSQILPFRICMARTL